MAQGEDLERCCSRFREISFRHRKLAVIILKFTYSVVEFENLGTREEKVVGIQDEQVVVLEQPDDEQVSVFGLELVDRPVREVDRLEQQRVGG